MPINPDAVGMRTEVWERSWTSTDTLLYAISVGAGSDEPTGPDLRFTTENSTQHPQAVLPTFAVIPGARVPGLAKLYGTYDKAMLVHAEHAIELHSPLPVAATAHMQAEITGIYDKGSAALIETRTTALDSESGAPMFTNIAKVFIRGEGGWGGDRGPSSRPDTPERPPDRTVRYHTRPDQALLYRLNGDRNPLHSDPVFAALAGFDRPIMHGLCTFGFSGRALLDELCDGRPERFLSMSGRFSRPVVPGEELSVDIWHLDDGDAAFLTTVAGDVVLDRGRCGFVG